MVEVQLVSGLDPVQIDVNTQTRAVRHPDLEKLTILGARSSF
jgi:hypothetical protein